MRCEGTVAGQEFRECFVGQTVAADACGGAKARLSHPLGLACIRAGSAAVVEGAQMEGGVVGEAVGGDCAAGCASGEASRKSPVGIGLPHDTRNFWSLLDTLSEHSPAQRTAAHSASNFRRHMLISMHVASWTLLLALPVIVWPIGARLQNGDCAFARSFEDCSKEEACRWSWTNGSGQGACIRANNGWTKLWGTMLLQFIFSVYSCGGLTVRYTVTGLAGTLLACANMLLLNGAFPGGAHSHSFSYPDRFSKLNSAWLPLCSDGQQLLTGPLRPPCYFNIWWERVTMGGAMTTIVIVANFTLFLWLCLYLRFESNTRAFALSTFIYLLMMFLDPNDDGFSGDYSVSVRYAGMVLLASIAALCCFFFPRQRFSALEQAEEVYIEAVNGVSVLLESMHAAWAVIVRHKAASALEGTEAALDELDAWLKASWYEDFGRGQSAMRRRHLRGAMVLLRGCLWHMPSVLHAAAALSSGDCTLLEERFASLRTSCEATCLMLRSSLAGLEPSVVGGDVEVQLAQAQVREDFSTCACTLSNEACAFVFMVDGVVASALCDYRKLFQEELQNHLSNRALPSLGQLVRTLRSQFQSIDMFDRSSTHPRFVVRNICSICIAFGVGWASLWNVMPAYSSYPASTIAVLLYTYTGCTAPLTAKRIAGVVLGKVIGTALQLNLGVKVFWKASLYAVFMWLAVARTFFIYLNSSRDISYVSCLMAAFIASSMMPSPAEFRGLDTITENEVGPILLNTIISSVIGVGIMSIVDLFLASKATKQARQRLLRAMQRARTYAKALLRDGRETPEVKTCERDFLRDLVLLRDVLPYATDEPAYWQSPFKVELCRALERHLRACGAHLATLGWAVGLLCSHGAALSDEPGGSGAAGGEVCSALLLCMRKLRSGIAGMMEAVEELTRAEMDAEAHGALLLRQQMLSALYSRFAHLAIGEMTGVAATWEPKREGRGSAGRASFQEDSPTGGVHSRPLANFYNKVIHEPLTPVNSFLTSLRESSSVEAEDGMPRKWGSETFLIDVDDWHMVFEELRRQAKLKRWRMPHMDNRCGSEIVILMVKSVLLDIQQMQLSLLDYGTARGT